MDFYYICKLIMYNIKLFIFRNLPFVTDMPPRLRSKSVFIHLTLIQRYKQSLQIGDKKKGKYSHIENIYDFPINLGVAETLYELLKKMKVENYLQMKMLSKQLEKWVKIWFKKTSYILKYND